MSGCLLLRQLLVLLEPVSKLFMRGFRIQHKSAIVTFLYNIDIEDFWKVRAKHEVVQWGNELTTLTINYPFNWSDIVASLRFSDPHKFMLYWI